MKKILLLDNDLLSRAWAIGGERYLNKMAAFARRDGFVLAVADVVDYEISKGPNGKYISNWLISSNVDVIETAEGSSYFEFQKAKSASTGAGKAKYRSALGLDGGDAAMVEIMISENKAGNFVAVASDDKFFRVSSNKMGVQRFGQAAESINISTPDFINKFRVNGGLEREELANARKLNIFNPAKNGYSPELSRQLLPDADVTRLQKEGGTATTSLLAKFGKGLKFLGIAGLIYDIGTSSAEAAEAARNGNAARAGEVMAKLAARTYGGLQLGMLAGGAAAFLLAGTPFVLAGVLLGGIAGGIAGAVAGDMLAERIWGAARKAIGMLSQTHPDNKVGYFAVVEQDLAARKVPGDIARKVAVTLNDGSLANAHVKTTLRKHIHQLDKAIAANGEAAVVGEIVVRHIDLGYNDDRSRTTVVDGDQEATVNQNGKILEKRDYYPEGTVVVQTIDEWVGDARTQHSTSRYAPNGKITARIDVTPDGRVEYYYDPAPGTRVLEQYFNQYDVLIYSKTVKAPNEAEERRSKEATLAQRKESSQAEIGHTEFAPMDDGSLDHSRGESTTPIPATIPVVTLPPVVIKEEIDPSGDVSDYFESSDVHDQIQDGWEAAQSQLDCYYDSSLSCGGTPVVLDLDRSGTFNIRLYANQPQPTTVVGKRAFQAPKFDFDGDGIPDRTAWVGPNDGFLVIDRGAGLAPGADGFIDQPQELAFTQWKTPQAWQAELDAQPAGGGIDRITDLSALRLLFDSNRDGVLDRNDEQWRGFRVWQDLNQDGVAGAGELRTLDQAGITAIGLVPDTSRAVRYADGSMITGTSYAQLDDGSQMRVGDAALRFESSAAARQKQDGMSGATGGCGVNCKLDNLVAAMAGFAPPAAGRLSLPPGLQQLPPGIIAAN